MENNQKIENIIENIEKVVMGKRREIVQMVKGVLAGGHILIEDVPGVGKTTMIKALAKTMDLEFSRVQFTPDLLPSDIIGVSIFNKNNNTFEFQRGPIFSNLVLADEINRTSPKTQSALLEAMEEYQITESNFTHKLMAPFIVMATQNPIEYEGTFPLPEAQLDRFMIKIRVGYPNSSDEEKILKLYKEENPIDDIKAVVTKEEVLELQKSVRKVKINDDILKYIINLVNVTRNHKSIALGGSIRASLYLQRMSQATALFNGRDYVLPEDVKENVHIVLSHRIIQTATSKAKNESIQGIINEIVNLVAIPRMVRNE